METTEISLKLSFDRRQITVLLSFFLLAWHPGFLGSETLTLTTYYPAPYGGYVSVLTTNQTLLARDGGNVGIGTPTPGNKLHVAGPGNTSVDIKTTGRIMTGDANNNGGVWLSQSADGFVGNTGGNVGFWTNGVGWNALSIVKASGNMGIGTTAPTERLSVIGNVSVSGNASINGDIIMNSSKTSYIRNVCERVYYGIGVQAFCQNGARVMGFTGDGVARVWGFLPLNQTSTGTGRYIVIGEDWAGYMTCCRFL